jgi:hypothetical protein
LSKKYGKIKFWLKSTLCNFEKPLWNSVKQLNKLYHKVAQRRHKAPQRLIGQPLLVCSHNEAVQKNWFNFTILLKVKTIRQHLILRYPTRKLNFSRSCWITLASQKLRPVRNRISLNIIRKFWISGWSTWMKTLIHCETGKRWSKNLKKNIMYRLEITQFSEADIIESIEW